MKLIYQLLSLWQRVTSSDKDHIIIILCIVIMSLTLGGCDPMPQYCLDYPQDEACMLAGFDL